MKMWIKPGVFLLLWLISMQWAFAAPPFVLEAAFQRIFDGEDKIFDGTDYADLVIQLSTMSDAGNMVAFYGSGAADGYKPHLFIHNFDSTGKPTEVSLPAKVGLFRGNTGLTSDAVGSRIFFVADDALDAVNGNFLFCMLDTTTSKVTVLLDASLSNIDKPSAMATDANGNYLYFNEADNGDRGDLWRIPVNGSTGPERVIQANSVEHPSGGYGRFIAEFDVSDDGNTIAFLIEGVSGSTEDYDKELFVKIGAGTPRYLTDDDNSGIASSKGKLRLSGDGSTIVYAGDETSSLNLMVTTATSLVGAQERVAVGYQTNCQRPAITTDGSVIFTRMTPEGISNSIGLLIHSDGSGQLKMDTASNGDGVEISCTNEGVHLSGGGDKVFFKARSRVASKGGYIVSLYTGVFNQTPWLWLGNRPWSIEVPTVVHVDYPAPLAFGITNPEDFPPFKVGVLVSDPQLDPQGVDRVAKQLLRFNGYPDDGGYGPIRVTNPTIVSAGSWESDGNRATGWPVPPEDPKYYQDPLEIEYARFSVKDFDGHVFYRDVILQAAEGGCSGTGNQTLLPEDMGVAKDVSCITDGVIETSGEVTVRDGVVLYLSGSGVYLNGSFTDFFKVLAGAEVIVR